MTRPKLGVVVQNPVLLGPARDDIWMDHLPIRIRLILQIPDGTVESKGGDRRVIDRPIVLVNGVDTPFLRVEHFGD